MKRHSFLMVIISAALILSCTSSNVKMTSKKGISLTIGILAAITIASFMFWFIPENNEMVFVISDFESHLDRVKDVHGVIKEGIDSKFQKLLNEEISPQEYIEAAEMSSSQIKSHIMQLVESKATVEWQESYINYIESLKQYNSYLRETMVAATMIEEGIESTEIEKIFNQIKEFKENSESLILRSDNARPGL
ncbi:MAG: hypothetical protein IH784_10810 [Bacteroidetes bacterium]|nr:hypothetical protein [Bacteroidota bacterium]